MKLILQTLLILIIVATFSICTIQPDMHKNVIVYDSAYTLVTEDEVKTETKEMPVMEMPAKPVEKTTKAETKVEPVTQTKKTQTTNVKQQTTTTPKKTTATKQTTTPQKPTTVKQTVTQPKTQTTTKPVTTTTTQKPVVKETVKTETPKVEQTIVTKPVEQPKTVTQQEETIAWNVWRSNLINQIMQDVKMPDVPQGTIFRFSFTVDKYGKVSNVQTGANPANYTPYAIQYIAPVIRSYQGRSILNFPEGTARTSTQVTGQWKMSTIKKYSTPQDFNDIEKVIR